VQQPTIILIPQFSVLLAILSFQRLFHPKMPYAFDLKDLPVVRVDQV
jgi:hypothetical protein